MTFAAPASITTERLTLRPIVESDLEAVLDYRGSAEVCRWLLFEPMDEASVLAKIRGDFARSVLEPGKAIFYGAEISRLGELTGEVMLRWANQEHRGGEIGWVFRRSFGGCGYATEAAHALLHLAFDEFELHRVVATMDGDNQLSARMAARLGMRKEAHFRSNEVFKGSWADEVIFAVLEDDWHVAHGRWPDCNWVPAPRPGVNLCPDQFNLVVSDMAASVRFYRVLGLDIPDVQGPFRSHHRSVPGNRGMDLDLDSQEFVRYWHSGWKGGMGVLGFKVPDRPSVDAVCARLTAAGYTLQQEPFDAFWGSRYAVAEDPDGNAVGIMSPREETRSWLPDFPPSGG